MFKKIKLKTAMAVVMATMALSSGTVMAMSEVMPYATAQTGSAIVPSGGHWETISGGKTFPSPDRATVTVMSSTETISANYPLYFKLTKSEDASDFSGVGTMTNIATFVRLEYMDSGLGVGIPFNVKARTNKNSKKSTTIRFTVSY